MGCEEIRRRDAELGREVGDLSTLEECKGEPEISSPHLGDPMF